MLYPRVLRPWLLAFTVAVTTSAQAVISTHSGVINFTEGPVFLDDQPLSSSFGTFPTIKEGSVFRTGEGRAEILLTPGVFLRIDQESAIRMVSSALDNTSVEFQRGTMILDSNDAPADAKPVVITYKNFKMRFVKPGVYRVDAEPGVFETYTGEAEITENGHAPKTIDESHQFFFNIGMETKKYGEGAVDTFSEWARNRAETITADNQAATQSLADPSAAPGGIFADPGANSGSIYTAPVPSFGFPGIGTYGGYGTYGNYGAFGGLPGFYGNPFMDPYGPFNNPFFGRPYPLVVYVSPRPVRAYPIPPRGPGYPVLSSTRTAVPRWSPTPLFPPRYPASSMQSGFSRTPVGHVGTRYPTVGVRTPAYGHVSVAAPRATVPAGPRPLAVGPVHR